MTAAANDWSEEAHYRNDAIEGSRRLRNAILKALRPQPERPKAAPSKRVRRVHKLATTPAPWPTDPVIDSIKSAVARFYGLRRTLLDSRTRRWTVSHPRQVAMYLARLQGASLPKVGRHFGRDHTTALHAWRAVEANEDLLSDARKIAVNIGDKSFSTMGKSLDHHVEQNMKPQEELRAA